MLFGLNLALICGVFGSIALLLSQFTRERGRGRLTGGLLLLFIVLDMVHRVISGTDSRRLSPIYYYNLSKPLDSEPTAPNLSARCWSNRGHQSSS